MTNARDPGRQARSASQQIRVAYFCSPLGGPDHDRCNALADNGALVTVFDWGHNASGYEWSIDDEKRYRLRSFSTGRNAWQCFVGGLRLIRHATFSRAEIAVIYQYQMIIFFLIALLMRIKGVRVISLNDSKFDDYPRRYLGDLAKIVMLAPYTSILAASKRAAQYVAYLGKSRVALYYCAIDTAKFRSRSRSSFHATAFADRYFLSVARFIPKKRHRELLAAYEQYANATDKPRRLVVCGYGPLESEIKKQIESSAVLARLVEMRGYVASSKLPEIVGRALGLLLPSVEEQFGIVVVEAMAAGIPVVVTSDCGACDVVTEGVNGFIVPSEDADQLVTVISRLSAISIAEWTRLSECAWPAARKADVSVFVEGVLGHVDAERCSS